jgi:hypothetical protein
MNITGRGILTIYFNNGLPSFSSTTPPHSVAPVLLKTWDKGEINVL